MIKLQTNYTDAVWSGNRKYTTITNDDNTISFVDATKYTVKGSIFGASALNNIGKQVNGVSGSVTLDLVSGGWSSSTITIDGQNYYTYSFSDLTFYTEHPNIVLGAAGTLPTSAEEADFTKIAYAISDDSSKTITFYAKERPTTELHIIVKGAEQ